MKEQPHFTILGGIGGVLCVISAFVPWWSQNGISVTGFSMSFAGYAGILTVILGLIAMVLAFGPFKKAVKSMQAIGTLTAIGAFIHIWRGYKLSAIGWGLFLMLLSAAFMIGASWVQKYQLRRKVP